MSRSARRVLQHFAFIPLLILLLPGVVHAGSDFLFKVHNNTSSRIIEIYVSEDGRNWGQFDIDAGIAPGATGTLVWDKSTDDEDCRQYFKAVFADGYESEPVIFDFCETGLVLEF